MIFLMAPSLDWDDMTVRAAHLRTNALTVTGSATRVPATLNYQHGSELVAWAPEPDVAVRIVSIDGELAGEEELWVTTDSNTFVIVLESTGCDRNNLDLRVAYRWHATSYYTYQPLGSAVTIGSPDPAGETRTISRNSPAEGQTFAIRAFANCRF